MSVIKKSILVIILIGLTLLIIYIFNSGGMFIKKTTLYKVYNEKGKNIVTNIYLKDKNSKGELVEEILIVFPEISKNKVLLISPKHQIIGIPEGHKPISKLIISNIAYLKKSAFKFTPINTGKYFDDLIDNYYYFSDNKIEFETFGELEKYGNRLIIKKIN